MRNFIAFLWSMVRYIRALLSGTMFSFKKAVSAPVSTFTGDPWQDNESRMYLTMPLNEKRRYYRCGGDGYQTLDSLIQWKLLAKRSITQINDLLNRRTKNAYSQDEQYEDIQFSASDKLNEKICLHQGDITRLEIDAIVNAANSTLLGGGGVDGSIHRSAGPSLKEECRTLEGCRTGMTKISGGHKLPAKYILHTVGPTNRSRKELISCYETCLQLVLKHEIRSVAFCCIATGVYGYPNRDAAHVALITIRRWLERNHDKVDRIIICTFLDNDYDIYLELMAKKYFKLPTQNSPKQASETVDDFSRQEETNAQVHKDPSDSRPKNTNVVTEKKKEPCESDDVEVQKVHVKSPEMEGVSKKEISEEEDKTEGPKLREPAEDQYDPSNMVQETNKTEDLKKGPSEN